MKFFSEFSKEDSEKLELFYNEMKLKYSKINSEIGVISTFMQDRGWGLIYRGSDKEHLFFHMSAFPKAQKKMKFFNLGDLVSFDIGKGDKGPRAKNAHIIAEDDIRELFLKESA